MPKQEVCPLCSKVESKGMKDGVSDGRCPVTDLQLTSTFLLT